MNSKRAPFSTMTEPKRRKVEAEEERLERVWGSGAWGDILTTVFHLLPPRERFLVQRVSTLFQRKSEKARLAVGELELTALNRKVNEAKEFKFVGKILDPSASEGVTSLRLPDLCHRFVCGDGTWCREFLSDSQQEAYRSRLEESRRKCEEALAKLSLPTLSHVSLCTGPLTQSLLPFLRSHPSISSLHVKISPTFCYLKGSLHKEYSENHFKEARLLCQGLAETKIRKLTICEDSTGGFEYLRQVYSEGITLFENLEEFSSCGAFPVHLQRLPNIAQLRTVHFDLGMSRYIGGIVAKEVCSSLLTGAPGLRKLSFTSWRPYLKFDLNKAAPVMQKLSLESLHIGFVIDLDEHSDCADVRAIVESLASGGESCDLTQSLQELTVSVRSVGISFERFDMSALNVDAFLRFPRLHSLRLRMELPSGFGATWPLRNSVSYEALPVIAELNGRLRVLEIPVLLPEAEGTTRDEILAKLQGKLVPFLRNAASVEGGAVERKFQWLPIFRPATRQGHRAGRLIYDHSIRPMAVEYSRRQDEGWVMKKVETAQVKSKENE